MFELSLALKYLVPRKSRLSASLIAFLSVGVISLVVWLLLVFLSITEGMEKGWLQKLTTLNAHLRITPTPHYYSSYYYKIDSLSYQSNYSLKTIAEKMQASQSDPYLSLEDGELPLGFPLPDLDHKGQLKDPVKGLITILEGLKEKRGITYQDFELSAALLRLQLLNKETGTQGYLTQVSYLATLPSQSPSLSSLILPQTEADLNNQLFLAKQAIELVRQDAPTLEKKTNPTRAEKRIKHLLDAVVIEQLKTSYPFWQIPLAALREKYRFAAEPQYRNGTLYRIDIPLEAKQTDTVIWRENKELYIQSVGQEKKMLSPAIPLLTQDHLLFTVKYPLKSPLPRFLVRSHIQKIPFETEVGLDQVEVVKAQFPLQKNLELATNEENEIGIFLAKSFIENGVKTGDRGYLSYSSNTSGSLQEQRLPIFVSGFYDPGVLSIGNKCILVPPSVTQTINASSSSFNLDKTLSNGILIWLPSLDHTLSTKLEIEKLLVASHLDKDWRVMAYYEYEFAKDLLEQFESDKTLFMLVGIIILIVGCCNIISMLVLLVNDKSKEIGILQAMGASRLSIAALFGICGIVMGVISSCIGLLAAILTLENIDAVVRLLSFFQGHNAFNPTFFGASLPKTLSHHATLFVLITTPLLALIAGVIPSIKACKIQPSTLLRNE